MNQFKINRWKTVLRRQVSSTLLAVIIAFIVAVPLVALGAETDSTPEDAIAENKPWSGDFNEMAAKRQIRVLVVYSKTFYFLDRGRQRGISYDLLKEFEKFVNKKLKTKTLKVHVVFIPVRRNELIPGLVTGRGGHGRCQPDDHPGTSQAG